MINLLVVFLLKLKHYRGATRIARHRPAWVTGSPTPKENPK